MPWLKKHLELNSALRFLSFLDVLATFITLPFVSALASALGLVAVTITGALGGALVYGPDVDPFVSLIYRLLF